MNNNTVPTHSVVDPRGGSQTPLADFSGKPTTVCIKLYIII